MQIILSQVFVALSSLLFVFSMICKNKLGLIIFLFISDILYATHYIFLDGLSGSACVFIDAIFLITIYLLEKYNKNKYTSLATIIAMIAVVVATIWTWSSAISLAPMLGMLAYLGGMMLQNITFNKLGAMLRNIGNIVYMILIIVTTSKVFGDMAVGLILEIILMISAMVGAIISYRQQKKINK